MTTPRHDDPLDPGASEALSAVDLAREPDFWLGGLLVSPSSARVRAGEVEHRVEPRVMEVLLVLTRRAGRTMSRDQLIEACWAGRIVSDDAVNRVLAQVRSIARLQDPAPFVLETVPKVGVRLIPVDAAPQAPPAAPSHQAAPVSSPPRASPRPHWVWPAVTAAVLALIVLGAGAGWWWRQADRPPAQNGQVEVMQFEARSADAGVQQAAADIPQDLVRILTAGGVQTAQEPLKRDDAASDAELRVAGSVGLEAGKYVITGQIIDRASGIVLWADRVERTAKAQARSPGDFAAGVAAVLDCTLKDRRLAKKPLSTEAMGLYLNACAGVFFRDDGGERMLAVTRKLVKVAPDFAGAHAMHSIAAALVASAATLPAEAQTLHAEAKAAAETAIRLDPRAAKAYSGLAINQGVWRNELHHDWFAEEHFVLEALKYDPDLAPARNEYVTVLRATGRTAAAMEMVKVSAAAEDPRYGGDPRLAMLMAATGDVAGAEAELSAMEAHNRVSQREARWTIAFWWDEPSAGLRKIRALADDDTPQPQACFETFLQELDVRRARHIRGLPASCDQDVDPSWRVRMLAREGDVDGAFALLQGALPGSPLFLYYPEMRAVRADPRFWTLAKRIGLVDYWRKSGRWPDFCAEPGLPYDCKAAAQAVMARPA